MEFIGLSGMGFWLFLAACVVGGMWFDSKKRETQQETLRRVVESGQKIDEELINKLMETSGGSESPDQDLKVGGIITGFVAVGLVILGWFLAKFNDKVFDVMLGVSLLVFTIAIGLYVAGSMTKRWNQDK